MLSLNLLTTTGQQIDFKDFTFWTCLQEGPEENISLRRGGDIDHLLPPPLLGHHLQALVNAVESLKDPNNLTGKEEDQRLLLLHHLIIIQMVMADTKEVDIVRRL